MLEIITECPACGSTLVRVKNQLFCRNYKCEAKNSKVVEKFTKTMKIMGLGGKTLEKLGITSIHEIYNPDLGLMRKVLGDKITDKLLTEIEKSQTIPLSTFLESMSIPLIGKVAGEKIESIDKSIIDITYEDLLKAGLGPKAAENFLDWVEEEWIDNYSELPLTFVRNEKQEKTTNIVVCISGKIPGYTKSQIEGMLAKVGVEVSSSLTKKVQYLISESSTTSKVQKAIDMNIPVMGLEQFIEEIIDNE